MSPVKGSCYRYGTFFYSFLKRLSIRHAFQILSHTLKFSLVPKAIEQELGINDFLQSRQSTIFTHSILNDMRALVIDTCITTGNT